MTEHVLGSAGSTRRRWTLLLPLAAAIATAVFYIPSAVAVHDLGLFELDRNAVEGTAAGDDWATLYDGGSNTGGGSDDFSGVLPDIGAEGGTQFHGGGSKDDLDITSWLWKRGEPLDKDDITNAYAAAYTNTQDTANSNPGDLIIYFGLDRFSTAGAAQVGFWFLQDPDFGPTDTRSQGGFTFSGQHVNGDVLVQSNFTNGGVISNLTVYQWQSGALVPVINAADCNPTPPATNVDDKACATVNTSATSSPWPYTPKANEGVSGTFQTSAFFEGGINISQLVPSAGCFTAFVAETRSSTPFDAVLKDFVIGDLDTCVRDVGVEKTPDGGQADAGDSISFSMTVTNLGDAPAENVTLSDTLPNSGLNWSIASQPTGDPCQISGTPQVLSCDFGTLPVGASRTVSVSSQTDAADCGTKNNTVTVSADGDIDSSNDSDTGDITIRCGALQITKTAKHAGTGSADLSGTFTVVDAAGSSHDLEVVDGFGCVDGIAIGTTTSITEDAADFPGYAVPDIADVEVAAGTCSNGTLDAGGTVVEVENVPLTDITWSVDSQHDGATSTIVDCKDADGNSLSGYPTTVSDGTDTLTDVLPTDPSVTVTCDFTVDP